MRLQDALYHAIIWLQDQREGQIVETTTDRIERQIDIDADAQRVWDLVARPGWWINEGTIIDHEFDATSDINVIHHEKYGDFRIKTVALDPPHHAAFRWLPGDSDDTQPSAAGSTLVEFWLDERAGGVTLRVVESGFASLNVTDEERRKNIDGNTEGWEIELAAARSYVLGA